jgi:hypothetical protein
VQGRITTRQLPLAEKSCPGIGALYRELEDKPATFLQLLWIYEARRMGTLRSAKSAQPRRRR